MPVYVLDLHTIDRTQVALVGGKAAALGELSRMDGVNVPPGFCVTTKAFQRPMANRNHAIPADVAEEIIRALARLGSHAACAVRSSATAEDSPTASFAGQHDSFLNVVGAEAILEHIDRCWASLSTERAVAYRTRNGFAPDKVGMAVVVQQMIAAESAGVLFTADPVTGNRKVTCVETTFGLGDALVGGVVNTNAFRVRDGEIIDRPHDTKAALSDAQVVELERLGRCIEAHFGRPQDIEWCLADETFYIVQSRPITTLFPIPQPDDLGKHVYVSVGHGQMMTDAMKPLGLSMWQLTTARPMSEAGGRLFVDVAQILASPGSRAGMMTMLGKSDPLIGDALQIVIDRGDFLPLPPNDPPVAPSRSGPVGTPVETDPTIPAGLIARNQESIAAMQRDIRARFGTALLDFIATDIQESKRILFDPVSHAVIMTGMEATWWLNDKLQDWLGETNAADTLTQSVPHNITSEMGLALLDVADVIRPHAAVVAFLRQTTDDGFLTGLPAVTGGAAARDAIQAWLDTYGVRGVGEIDITRPRFRERPSMLIPILVGHIESFPPGESKRRFEQGLQQATEKEAEVLARLRALPGGEAKADETKRMIDRVRTFAGYREYPKFGKVSRDFIYKQALMEEAARLVHAGVLRETSDIFYLRFEELQDVVRTQRAGEESLRRAKDAFASHQALTPPRVLTSDGEIITGSYRRSDVPAGAVAGLAVSAGTVEGRARVIVDMATADLQPGDILVTVYTDPSWTPLFVAIAGLVTEVGGLMTHGAVIAREYGVPAVVGVEHATQRIRDGQRIRVHGTAGYVEILA